MKLATFAANGQSRLGIVVGDGVIDLADALPDAPRSMIALIEEWSRWRPAVQKIEKASGKTLPLKDVSLLAPIPRPGKVLAIGLNYADHIAETRFETPQHQVWFCKQPTSINGPYAPIEIPVVSTSIDYEAELVAVMGRKGRHISKEDAPGAVFGYMAGNDVSVRDYQRLTPQWMLGKSFDTHAPTGPWITTSDEVDPHTLGIRCFVNGEQRQSSNTKNLVFNTFDQIAYLSQAMTLEPGDLIFTGTPGGVGLAMKPTPQFLKPGDRVRVEIDQLGAIEASMVAEAR